MCADALYSTLYPRLSGEESFLHYEHARARLPQHDFSNPCIDATGLVEIADRYDVFVFDAYGVLNVGNTPIAASPAVVRNLRDKNKKVFVLSNGASFTRAASVGKFQGFGYDFSAEEIVSSRMAAELVLAQYGSNFVWGAMAKPDYSAKEFAQPSIKLEDNSADYEKVDGFLLLSTLDWNEKRQEMLEKAFEKNPRPVIVANPDVVSPREDHFGMEPGYVGHRLIEEYSAVVEFHGKPFPSVFELVDNRLGSDQDPTRVCMVGDTLHTDILGAAAHGWHTVLVTDHGMFKGLDAREYIARCGIVPDWIVPSI